MGHQRGRPPLDPNDPSVPVNVNLPSKQLAALSNKAKAERCTIQDVIRRMTRLPDQQNKTT